MDKILKKLSGHLTPEDLKSVKESFESIVDASVKKKLDERSKSIAKDADEFCKIKIEEGIAEKTVMLEKLAEEYCADRISKVMEKAQKRIDSYSQKLEEVAEQYIFEYFDEKFDEKYGEELAKIEENLITSLDNYLEYTISSKIDSSLIQKTAINETYEPIINAIKVAFEDKYVPLDVTGTSKINEARAEVAELEASLKKQISENMRLAGMVENANKKALIASKTSNLSESMKVRVNRMFKNKSYSEVRSDIDEYISIINESNRVPRMKTNPRLSLNEGARRKGIRNSKSLDVEDISDDVLLEKYRPNKMVDPEDSYLSRSAKYLD